MAETMSICTGGHLAMSDLVFVGLRSEKIIKTSFLGGLFFCNAAGILEYPASWHLW